MSETEITGSWPNGGGSTRSLRFERRRSPRLPASGRFAAFSLGGGSFGRLHGLEMIDASDGGIAVRSDDPIVPGTTLSLGTMRGGIQPRRAVVLRCQPCGNGYRVALAYERRLAA